MIGHCIVYVHGFIGRMSADAEAVLSVCEVVSIYSFYYHAHSISTHSIICCVSVCAFVCVE